MSNPLYAFPTTCEQTLRALARYPSRTAFSWPGGSLTYQGATDLIGRMQGVFAKLGFAPGTRTAFLTANRADTWCAGVAAQLSRLAITWLHPLGSLDDQLFQLEDSEAQMLIVDGVTFRDRGGALAAKASGVKTVFTLGPADYGVDLLQAIEAAGAATPRCFAPANPRARCATTANMAALPMRSWPTSKFPTRRAISRSHRSAMSREQKCCRR
jgi:fatty-acyl-CoA synthase